MGVFGTWEQAQNWSLIEFWKKSIIEFCVHYGSREHLILRSHASRNCINFHKIQIFPSGGSRETANY